MLQLRESKTAPCNARAREAPDERERGRGSLATLRLALVQSGSALESEADVTTIGAVWDTQGRMAVERIFHVTVSALASGVLVACGSFGASDAPHAAPLDGDASDRVTSDAATEAGVAPDGSSAGEVPREIARVPEEAVDIACEGADLVVAAGQRLYAVAREGGEARPIVKAEFAIGGVDVFGREVFYAIPTLGAVMRRSLDDLQAEPFIAVTSEISPHAIHFIGARLYFVAGAALKSVDPTLGTNGDRKTQGTLLSAGAHALHLVPAADRIYVAHADGALVAYDYAGGTAFALPANGDVRGVAAEPAGDVFFTQSSDGTIWRGTAAGQALRRVAGAQPGVRGVCRRNDVLYWVRADGTVWTMRAP
jgi:hypothetical protein